MKMLIKIIVGSVVMLLAAMGGLAVFLSSDSGQRWLREFCVGKLADTLHTRIDVKHIGIGFLTGDVTLYGAEIYDRSEVKMLSVDTLEADIDLTGIFHREIGIEGVRLAGATAVAVGTANFTNPTATIDVIDGIIEYCESQGVNDINELIGALEA